MIPHQRSRILFLPLLFLVLSFGTVNAEARLVVNPSVIDFGTTLVGQPLGSSVLLWNTGQEDIYVERITEPNGFFVENLGFFRLRPGQTRIIRVYLHASTPGVFGGHVTISHDQSPFAEVVLVVGAVEELDPGPQMFLVEPTADAFTKQDDPNANFGSAPVLRVRHPDSGAGRQSFLRFMVPAHTGTVISAKLRIRTGNVTVQQASFYDVDMTWNENTITWNNWLQGGTTFEVLQNLSPLAGQTWHEIDVQDAIPEGGGLVTIGIASSSVITGQSFYSRESSLPPTLEVIVD